MKIKFTTCMAGADFVRNPGDVADVEAAQAARLIQAGFAVPAKEPKALRTATQPQPALETATQGKGEA